MDILELNYSKPKIRQSGCISLKNVSSLKLPKMLEIAKVSKNVILVNDYYEILLVTFNEIKKEISLRNEILNGCTKYNPTKVEE